jgi:CPA1 family monovalent cation:H+ antiporter
LQISRIGKGLSPVWVWYTIVIGFVAILARMVWVFPATYIPRWASRRVREHDPQPRFRNVFLVAWTQMRGVVSLAAALALPLATPGRDVILFVTFGVIILTLVGQGAILPAVARWLGLTRLGIEERRQETRAELDGRQAALKTVIDRLEDLVTDRKIPEDVITLLRTRNESRQQILPQNLEDGLDRLRLSAEIKKELIDAEREFIYQLLRDGKITDEARRRIEYELDLEEASVANRGRDGGGWF